MPLSGVKTRGLQVDMCLLMDRSSEFINSQRDQMVLARPGNVQAEYHVAQWYFCSSDRSDTLSQLGSIWLLYSHLIKV
jgi:hypothetical protein